MVCVLWVLHWVHNPWPPSVLTESSFHCYPHRGIRRRNIFLVLLEFVYFIRTTERGHQNSFLVSSVQFSRSVVSNSLRPHESQHTRPPSPSPAPGVHSDSRPSSQLCHPAISSSVVPFSSCPQSLPASESFPMSQLFA